MSPPCAGDDAAPMRVDGFSLTFRTETSAFDEPIKCKPIRWRYAPFVTSCGLSSKLKVVRVASRLADAVASRPQTSSQPAVNAVARLRQVRAWLATRSRADREKPTCPPTTTKPLLIGSRLRIAYSIGPALHQ